MMAAVDFVMRPLGRFFQVTETLDTRKYFLDIDKIEHYPISLLSNQKNSGHSEAKTPRRRRKRYSIKVIVEKYMECIEEIINLPVLRERFTEAVAQKQLRGILDEIIRQSKVEFNYEED